MELAGHVHQAAEVAAALDGNPREKFTSVEAMLAAIGR